MKKLTQFNILSIWILLMSVIIYAFYIENKVDINTKQITENAHNILIEKDYAYDAVYNLSRKTDYVVSDFLIIDREYSYENGLIFIIKHKDNGDKYKVNIDKGFIYKLD